MHVKFSASQLLFARNFTTEKGNIDTKVDPKVVQSRAKSC